MLHESNALAHSATEASELKGEEQINNMDMGYLPNKSGANQGGYCMEVGGLPLTPGWGSRPLEVCRQCSYDLSTQGRACGDSMSRRCQRYDGRAGPPSCPLTYNSKKHSGVMYDVMVVCKYGCNGGCYVVVERNVGRGTCQFPISVIRICQHGLLYYVHLGKGGS